jgi:hypothetical protein
MAESEPILGAESPIDDCALQDEHIDPRVVAMSCRILRHRERGFGRHGPPRLDPRYSSGLQLGDDLVGDVLIALSTGASASDSSQGPRNRPAPRRRLWRIEGDIADLRDGRREPLSRTSTRHGRPANLSL